MDARNVIFPMTAGDLVVSAGVLCWERKAQGSNDESVECVIRHVASVERAGLLVHIEFEPSLWEAEGENIVLLQARTPVLITDIRRS